MKILVGCPVKDRAWALPKWFGAVNREGELAGVEIEYVFIYSESADETLDLLIEQGADVLHDKERGRGLREINGHFWGEPSIYEYMARIRNRLLQVAIERRPDYFFSLDSDIILPKGGLKHLLQYADAQRGVVAPAVNMSWGSTNWNTMSWAFPTVPNTADRPMVNPPGGRADVIMGALLIDEGSLDYMRWEPHYQGEDIGFCRHAEYANIPRWWVPEIRCDHLMRPE